MTNSIITKKDGYTVSDSSNTIFFSNAELANVGCKNCVWKYHGQCPYRLKEHETEVKIVNIEEKYNIEDKKDFVYNICPEMLQFLISLADKGDTASGVWEKFLIYKARLQESEDYADYLRLKNENDIVEERLLKEYSTLNPSRMSDEDSDKLRDLRHDRASAKMWWSRLNSQATTSLQKVCDRDAKAKDGVKVSGIMNAKTINFFGNQDKKIEDKTKGVK